MKYREAQHRKKQVDESRRKEGRREQANRDNWQNDEGGTVHARDTRLTIARDVPCTLAHRVRVFWCIQMNEIQSRLRKSM